jgi:signal transduction histidine kinase
MKNVKHRDCLVELDRLEGLLDNVRGQLEAALSQQRQFMADASHELRTPIAGLRAELEEARLHPGETDLAELLDHALNNVDRLQAIIIDLLLLGQLERGVPTRLQPMDLGELVREEVCRRMGRIEVELRIEPGVVVNAIPVQICRVLASLLDNAQRHATRAVEVRVRRDGGIAELVVTDDGAGIPDADKERIFQRFGRLDAARSRDRGGAGLSLAIAREIVHSHEGTLTVRDSPSGGSSFLLRLGLAQAS